MKKRLLQTSSLFFILFLKNFDNMMLKNFDATVSWKKILYFGCFAVLVWTGCKEETKADKPVEKIQNFGSGKISRRYFEVKGKKEGKMTDYYPEGELKAEKMFKNDRQVGRTVLYYPSGKTKEVQYYEDGLRQGGDTVFYEDGKPEFIVEFNKGKKNGYLRKWAPDGTMTYEAKFENETLVEVKGKPIHNSATVPSPIDAGHNGSEN